MAGTPDDFISAYNERDWERMRAMFASGCVYEQIGRPKQRVEGPAEVVKVFQGWADAVPEARGQIAGRIEAGDGATLEIELEGKMKGPYGDFSPAGKPPVARAALVFHLDGDGRISELRNYYDSLVLYQVLGIQG